MYINVTQVNLILARAGMTRSKLAEQAGVSRQNISTVLQRGTCAAPTLGKIARALGVDPAEIIKEDKT